MTRPRVRGLAALIAVPALVVACSGGGAAPVPTIPPATPTPTPGPSVDPTESPLIGYPEGCPTEEPAPLPAGETRTVTIKTDLGDIVLSIEADLSPIAAGNFVALADCGWYDNVVFHRVVPGFVIQGGDGQYGRVPHIDPALIGSGGPAYRITDEPVTATYGRGTVAMARTSQPNSVGSQFFIVMDDAAEGALASYNTYQIIGTVASGIEVADAVVEAAGGAENPANPVVMNAVLVETP